MPISFRVDSLRRCVFAVGVSPLTDGDLTQYQIDLAAHADHGKGFDQLFDMRAVDDGVELTHAGVRIAGHMTDQYAEYLQETKIAIVVSTSAAFGMARMLAAYLSGSLEVNVFKAPEAARIWLGQGD